MATKPEVEMNRGSPSDYTTEDGRPKRPEGEYANRSRNLAASIYDAQVRGVICEYKANVLDEGLLMSSIDLDKAQEKLRSEEKSWEEMADFVQTKLREEHKNASRRAVPVTIYVDDMDKYRVLQDRLVARGYSNCSIEPWDQDEEETLIEAQQTPEWIAEELSDMLLKFIPNSSVDFSEFTNTEVEVDIYPQQILTKTDNEDETAGESAGFEGLGSLFG